MLRVQEFIQNMIPTMIKLVIFLCLLTKYSSILSLVLQGWPIFYISRRMVSIEKEIKIIKFRTMLKDATIEK